MSRVFPGVPDTLASPLPSVSMLMSDDFPTLLRPMKAMSFRSSFGTCEMRSGRAFEFGFGDLHRSAVFGKDSVCWGITKF